MKIFERDGKINFVDENNVFLGYDNRQDCCEDFGWFFTDKPPTQDIEESVEFNEEDFVFDQDYFLEVYDGQGGGRITFKLVNKINNREIFLTIYNYHNGYYSHGFSFSIDGVVKYDRGL